MFPGPIPEAMLDPSIEPSNDWRGWKPIDSIITDDDLDRVETKIGYPLPQSYREFLKYKHFYELDTTDSAVNFPQHLPDKDLKFLISFAFDYMIPELIIHKGYIYFADFEDYGLLCFNTNEQRENNEYPIVYIDHDDLKEVHLYANNFMDLLEGDEGRGDRFVDYLNSLNN